MTDLPSGTITFLFTDIEGSTRLWERHPREMAAALERHDAVLRWAVESSGGRVFKTWGDAFCAVFPTARGALGAALAAQEALIRKGELGFTGDAIRVRIALHTGVAHTRDDDYLGPSVNRASRLLSAAHGGQILLTQATCREVQDVLPPGVWLHDLGRHRLKDLQQPERIFQVLHPALPADFPPLRSLEAFAHNLPIQLTSFIGRRHEMESVRRLIDENRLLTLTGAGGVGKTRLALQVAAELVDAMRDGVWLVELGTLSDPALVPHAVAAELGVREPGDPSALEARLVEFLRPRHLLLLLDNCEHLVAACARLVEGLLRACPGLRILATTREPLGVPGEVAWRVPSLTQPDPRQVRNGGDPVAAITEYESTRLFIERAKAVLPSFQLTPSSAPSVAQVCHRLDGIPLAIELAAARVKVLSVEQIAAGLDDSCRLLTGGSRTALPRQQTLRATMDWSYHLLSNAERALLRRLSVFAGGFTLEAAEAVCAESYPGGPAPSAPSPVLAPGTILDLLGSLVDKSLVLAEETGGAVRYRLLETIRQYGREHLEASGEAKTLRQRHWDWFLALAERAEPELDGPEQRVWLDRLEREHDNLRAALRWAEESGQAEAGLHLGRKLWQFWWVRGYLAEGRERLAGLLSRAGPSARTAARAKALQGAGILAQDQGDYRAARAFHEESLAIKRELGDLAGIAASLNNLGHVARLQGDFASARSLYEEALAIEREGGDRRGLAFSLRGLGLIARYQGNFASACALYEEALGIARQLCDYRAVAISLNDLGLVSLDRGDVDAAERFYRESLALKEELGDRRGIAFALNGLGLTALYRGAHVAARARFEESLAIRKELGDRRGIAFALHGLGTLALHCDDLAAAGRLHEESLAMRRELGDKHGVAASLASLAEVARRKGDAEAAAQFCDESLRLFRQTNDRVGLAAVLEERAAIELPPTGDRPEKAARLLAGAAALREATGASVSPAAQAKRDRLIAAARDRLDEATFRAAWQEGYTAFVSDAEPAT